LGSEYRTTEEPFGANPYCNINANTTTHRVMSKWIYPTPTLELLQGPGYLKPWKISKYWTITTWQSGMKT
jgi:hypothetical protein